MAAKPNTALKRAGIKKDETPQADERATALREKKKAEARERAAARRKEKKKDIEKLGDDSQLKKVQLLLSQEQFHNLTAMRKEIGLATNKAFFDLAISLLFWVLSEKKSGRIIASVDQNEQKLRELVLPGVY